MEKFIDVIEAAELLHLTPKALRLKVARRQVPFRRLGKLIRFYPQELEKYMSTLAGCGVAEAAAKIEEHAA